MNDALKRRLADLDSMSDAIAMSSPSGRMSKRARRAAEQRWMEKYGSGMAPEPVKPQPKTREQLLQYAAFLRDLAARGLQPRAHLKLAAELEAQAAE